MSTRPSLQVGECTIAISIATCQRTHVQWLDVYPIDQYRINETLQDVDWNLLIQMDHKEKCVCQCIIRHTFNLRHKLWFKQKHKQVKSFEDIIVIVVVFVAFHSIPHQVCAPAKPHFTIQIQLSQTFCPIVRLIFLKMFSFVGTISMAMLEKQNTETQMDGFA